jgi:hypothetical protein
MAQQATRGRRRRARTLGIVLACPRAKWSRNGSGCQLPRLEEIVRHARPCLSGARAGYLPVILALLLGLFAAPFTAKAQQAASPVRIGFMPLGSPSNAYNSSLVEAFRQGLREAGLVYGHLLPRGDHQQPPRNGPTRGERVQPGFAIWNDCRPHDDVHGAARPVGQLVNTCHTSTAVILMTIGNCAPAVPGVGHSDRRVPRHPCRIATHSSSPSLRGARDHVGCRASRSMPRRI